MPESPITPAVTPIEMSEDEEEKVACPLLPSPRLRSTQLTMDSSFYIDDATDSDMEMIDSQPSSSPTRWARSSATRASHRPSPFSLLSLPSNRNSQDHANGGRIPTPIYGYFRSVEMSMDVDAEVTPGAVLPQSRQELDEESQLRRRRLPTPISEDEAMDSVATTTILGRLDMGTNVYERQSLSERQRKTSTWPAADSSTRPKGGKTMLSMGYRTDCEKCRIKVPGHYNHVIRSPEDSG